MQKLSASSGAWTGKRPNVELQFQHHNKNTRRTASLLVAVIVMLMTGACSGLVSTPTYSTSLKITTTTLPNVKAGIGYETAIAALGGNQPYAWSLSSGSLPLGLSLNASSGVISGTSIQVGGFPFTVQVKDSSTPPQSITGALFITISPGSALSITTLSLPQGLTAQPYAAILRATGGIPGYTWSITSGHLPPGLMLGAASGLISGTPSVSGTFNLTVKIADFSSPPQTCSQSFTLIVAATPLTDAYGGLLAMPSPNGATGFFRIEKFGSRWMLVTPVGNAFWYLGVAATGNSAVLTNTGKSYTDYISAKYGTGPNGLYVWASQEKKRMLSWGFNSLGFDESPYMRGYGVNGSLPVNPLMPQFEDRGRFEIASMRNSPALISGPVKNIGWMEPLVSIFADVFDPAYETYANALMAQNTQNTTGGVQEEAQSPWIVGYALDDSDDLNGFNSDLAPHLGWMVLATAPTQSTGFVSGMQYAYSDPTVYSKLKLRDFLKVRYNNDVTALNNAWGSAYTTWDTAGGYGLGMGLLDENGRTHPWMGKYSTLAGETEAMQKDLNDFEFLFAQRYFQVAYHAIRSVDPNHLILGPVSVSSSTRPNILLAAKPYVDAFIAASEPLTNLATCNVQAPASTIYDLTGKPVIAASYFFEANQDSSVSVFPSQQCHWGLSASKTQAERGQNYATFLGEVVGLKAADGTYPMLGFHWWSLYDSWDQKQNFGLTTFRDNAYDGAEALIAPGIDAWGFPTGGEVQNYGDFLSFARNANSTAMKDVVTNH